MYYALAGTAMSGTTQLDAVKTSAAQLVTYDISEAQIAETKAKYAALEAVTPKGYEDVRLAIGECRRTRVKIEARRVELKADALAFGRLVDSEAKRWTARLEEIETPLQSKKDAVDAERDRVRREAEEKKRLAIEAEVKAKRDAEEAALKAVRDAEEARLAEERARLEAERAELAEERRRADEVARVIRQAEEAAMQAERDRLAEERRQSDEAARVAREAEEVKLKAERERLAEERRVAEEAQRVEREAIEAERRKVAAEREAANRAEFERQTRIKAEHEAIVAAERQRVEAAENTARIAALAPDMEKVRVFVASIRDLATKQPAVKSKAAKMMLSSAVLELKSIADGLESAVQVVGGAK